MVGVDLWIDEIRLMEVFDNFKSVKIHVMYVIKPFTPYSLLLIDYWLIIHSFIAGTPLARLRRHWSQIHSRPNPSQTAYSHYHRSGYLLQSHRGSSSTLPPSQNQRDQRTHYGVVESDIPRTGYRANWNRIKYHHSRQQENLWLRRVYGKKPHSFANALALFCRTESSCFSGYSNGASGSVLYGLRNAGAWWTDYEFGPRE